jgi:hypothetical protein
MTVKTNKPGVVTLTCEGIRTTGVMCDGEIKVSIENKPYTKTARVTVARKRAQVKGWSLVKRADACPRVHGMIPLPAPKTPAALVA